MLVVQMTCKRDSTSDVLLHLCAKMLSYGAMNFISFYQGMVDPGTNRYPSWSVTPASAETAVEGRSKTLYCFADGR